MKTIVIYHTPSYYTDHANIISQFQKIKNIFSQDIAVTKMKAKVQAKNLLHNTPLFVDRETELF